MKKEARIDLGPVYFRPITLEDTDRIISWRNSDRVRRNFIDQRPFTRQGHLNWMETRVAAGEVVQFILCETGTDRPVGSVYIRDIDRKNEKGEYGIFIGEADAAGTARAAPARTPGRAEPLALLDREAAARDEDVERGRTVAHDAPALR